ncbi:uncharacterized protein TRAVEDRAFT_68951 [Trametes versicolor FP-101664 SS1]|uniref:uncharacterized protein n=1 Tax=Trametes versicolor (strain FP-101664) TaxID=717944 RepID=UPI0004623F50|nr:uncharacterized protein TRAVEDRAFT_68951 [Trametes versicolor FP-101664 SS1]EIW62565.1 hypothetical protein TRAVEDRAFT_68951 [Trametes versicolor FP-101664 SS1]
MATFTLTVNIASADITALKQVGYNLCIAKKVNNTYNTVWRGGSFLARNTFQWTSRYAVFGTETFAEGALVTAATESPEIKFGQTVLLDENGVMNNPTGSPNSSGTFTVDNEYAALNIGVMGYLGGAFSPIFVSPSQVVTGPVNLTPVESVLVWFDAQHTTSTIIVDSVSNTIEVDFTGGYASRSVTYTSTPGRPGTGAWALDSQLRLSATYNPTTNLFAVERPSAQLLLKMASIINADDAAGDATVFKTTVEFNEADTQGVVEAFKQYAQDVRPHGLSEWDVSVEDDKVVMRLAMEDEGNDPAEAAREIPYKFLSILHGWTGPQYKKLTFEAPHADVRV